MEAQATYQRARALMAAGKADQAVALVQRALKSGEDPNLLALLGALLFHTGEHAKAEYALRRLVTLRPGSLEAMANLGAVLLAQSKFDEAIDPLRAGAADPEARANLVRALSGGGRLMEAVAAAREGLAGAPDHVGLLVRAGQALHAVGRVDEGLSFLRRAGELAPADVRVADALCAMMTYAPGLSRREVFEAFVRYGELAEQGVAPMRWDPATARTRPAGPLRVGLLSPDFRRHATMFFIEPLLEHADRSRFFFACYNAAGVEDEVSARVRARAGLWRRVFGVNADKCAAMIRDDRIDVLIDLAGHIYAHRLDVMARKPAPVQITYLGFPNTTGLTTVDWRLVDSLTDPEGAEDFATERLLRVDPCLLMFDPHEPLPEVGPLPMDAAGRVTFGSFSSLLKLNGPLIALWTRVLRAVPRSRLLLKHLAFRDLLVRQDVRERFERAGAPPESVMCDPPEASARAVLPAYNRVDISLDTFPYNGTTTICESLLMGVPVVSLRGEMSAGRVGLSLLSAVGLADLCAPSEDDFVRIAASLAAYPARLTAMRAGLRARFLASPLGDLRAGAARLTNAILGTWEAYLDG